MIHCHFPSPARRRLIQVPTPQSKATEPSSWRPRARVSSPWPVSPLGPRRLPPPPPLPLVGNWQPQPEPGGETLLPGVTRTSLRLRLRLLQPRASGAGGLGSRSPGAASRLSCSFPSGRKRRRIAARAARAGAPQRQRRGGGGTARSGLPGGALVPSRRAPRLARVALSLRRPDKLPGSPGPRAADWAGARAAGPGRWRERRSLQAGEAVAAQGSSRH